MSDMEFELDTWLTLVGEHDANHLLRDEGGCLCKRRLLIALRIGTAALREMDNLQLSLETE